MSLTDAFDLEGDRKCVYRYVERHGPADPSMVARATDTEPEPFHHHVAMLRRDGLVEETPDGRLQVAVHPGEAEQFTEAGVSYEIRPARQSDLSGLVGVIQQASEDETSIVAQGFAEQLTYEDTILRQTPTRSRFAFVATVADDVVGWAHVEGSETPKLAGTAELTLGVIEEYRRHGIGSHLLQRGVSWAGARGCRKVYQSVPAANETGIAFLETNGWAVEAVREDHYEVGGRLVDEVMLARRLD